MHAAASGPSFFIWVGVLLFNIITGLIVDTFSSLREEEADRQDVLRNCCFVCGFTRASYDDVGLQGGPSFDQHCHEVHDLWNYVYFYHYLKRKDPTEYNGVESYVAQMLKDQSLAWLPVRTSIVIQDHGAAADDAEDDVALAAVRSALRSELGGLRSEVQAVGARVEQLECKVMAGL